MTADLQQRMSKRRFHPCSSCQGTRFYAGAVGFEHSTGSVSVWLDLVICVGCGKAETFVDGDPTEWIQRRDAFEWVAFDIAARQEQR